jgi:hypothetical protein
MWWLSKKEATSLSMTRCDGAQMSLVGVPAKTDRASPPFTPYFYPILIRYVAIHICIEQGASVK